MAAYESGTVEMGLAPKLGFKPLAVVEDGCPQYRLFTPPAAPPHPLWRNEASIGAIHQLIADQGGHFWLATDGGVLEWILHPHVVTQHTSAHGLLGNATRCLAQDKGGLLWAGGASGGLTFIDPCGTAGWQPYLPLQPWRVTRLAVHPDGGVVAALSHSDGKSAVAICKVNTPATYYLQDKVESQTLTALWVAPEGTLWLGNDWGLAQYTPATGALEPISALGIGVGALAPHESGGLWVGTVQGLYHLAPDQTLSPAPAGPAQEVVGLTQAADGPLWVAMSGQLGYVVGGEWHSYPLRHPNGRRGGHHPIHKELSDEDRPRYTEEIRGVGAAPAASVFPCVVVCDDSIIGIEPPGDSRRLLRPSSHPLGSHVCHALVATPERVWAATARGIYLHDGAGWGEHDVNDWGRFTFNVLVAEAADRLWTNSGEGGINRLEVDFSIPEAGVKEPILAMAAGAGALWAATFDTVYERCPAPLGWRAIPEPIRPHLGAALIQALCYEGTAPQRTLWAGTSQGLLRYRPAPELWDWIGIDLSIQALAHDEQTGDVWAATVDGLVCANSQLRLGRGRDVRSLVFDPRAGGGVWVGTTQGLEAWPRSDGSFDPAQARRFTVENSGLAANLVTALACRTVAAGVEVWGGTPAGICCYTDG